MEASLIISVCLNSVLRLLRVHVITGTGPPMEQQEIALLPPSSMDNFSTCSVVVLGKTK